MSGDDHVSDPLDKRRFRKIPPRWSTGSDGAIEDGSPNNLMLMGFGMAARTEGLRLLVVYWNLENCMGWEKGMSGRVSRWALSISIDL